MRDTRLHSKGRLKSGAVRRRVETVIRSLSVEPLEPRVMLSADSIAVFNEIMYNPADPGAPEWVELYNQNAVDIDLSGWSLSGGIDYTIPDGTVLRGGAYAVVAADPAALETATGFAGALGPFAGQLSNGGETLELRDVNDRILDVVAYDDQGDWPVGPDGSGATLAKREPLLATGDVANWFFSQDVNGTPGAANVVAESFLWINEIAGVSEPSFFVELQNTSGEAVDLGGMVIQVDGLASHTYVIPAQMLPAGGYVAFAEATLGFAPADEDRVFLLGPGQTTVLDGARAENTPRARSEELGGRWQQPDVPTPGTSNSFDFDNDVVIHEILYHDAPAPASSAQTISTGLLSYDAPWRFNQTGTDLGVNWATTTHAVDNIDWFSGPGLLGFETATLSEPIRTSLTNPQANNPFVRTYYFETEFQFNGDLADVDALLLSHMVDDGAVFYVNGVQAARFNMPGNLGDPVDASAFASPGVANAISSGNVVLPVGSLVVGENRLSVQVHQSSDASSDIVFGAQLTVQSTTGGSSPFAETPEEWIELYNRGNDTVDLSGWQLANAVGFTFREGATLAPGGYLVIARDAMALAAEYPNIAIAGQYDGKLSNSDERILLLDSTGNVADEVHYYDGGRWPGRADGGGSSLELRSPTADNSMGQAWAASDESLNSNWTTYTYRGTATNPIPGAPTLWQEFAFGMLDGPGEILIDDIRVIEDPDGAAIDRIQNGSFDGNSSASWRLLGNHQNSTVINDNGNFVLHVVADGATEYQGNQIETTFAGGASIVEGQEYEITFRARWLSGSRQLNSRLYFDRLARTTVLDVPNHNGTPGIQNSRHVANMGPTYANLRHGPILPEPWVPVTITVEAEDPDGVDAVTLWYSAGGGTWLSASMPLLNDGVYAGTLPGQAAGTVVQFYVEGRDLLGATSTFPAKGPDSRALYEVNDGLGSAGSLTDFRLIMTSADSNHMHEVTNVLSNQRLGATVIYGDEVFYDVGARLKGSFVGRNVARVGFNIAFNPDQLFRGVHDKVAVDRSAGGNIGVDELLLKHIANHAGGIPSSYDDVIFFIAPRAEHTSTASLRMAGFDSIYLDSQFQNGSDGTLYEYEVPRWATATVDGNPESLKVPGNGFANVDFQNLGNDKEAYRWVNLITSSRTRDDYSRIIAMGEAFSQSGAAFDAATNEVLDVDQWMRSLAFMSLGGVADTLFTGLTSGVHNFRLYARPEDNRVMLMPWDWDFVAYFSPFRPVTTSVDNTSTLVNQPTNLRLYYGHLLDIINTTFNTTYFAPWATHYSQLSGQDFSGFLNYVGQRSGFVLSQLPAHVPFTITTNGGNGFSTSLSSVTLAGDGWIDVREIRLAGSPNPYKVTWTDGDSWEVTVPLGPGANIVSLDAYDHQGVLVGTDSITVTSTTTVPLADATNLRITEINYNPHGPLTQFGDANVDNDLFEFVELINVSPIDAIELQGAAFTDGFDFVFTGSTQLAPGERVVVVRDQAAFESRYGTGHNIAGVFQNETGLKNSGEAIELDDAMGSTIVGFTYDDSGDWPGRADGKGASLEVIDTEGNYNSADNWQSSDEFGGSPGTDGTSPVYNVIVNEVLSHSDGAAPDLIELYNTTATPIDLGKWYLSDTSDNLFQFQVSVGTTINADQHLVFNETQLGFALDGQFGDDVWLIEADNATGKPLRFADHHDFDATDTDVSLGRWPSGDPSGMLFPMTVQTFGGANSGPVFDDLLITEVHYNPAEVPLAEQGNIARDELEYIELYNDRGDPLDIGNWSTRGISFTFPVGTTVAVGEAIVVVTFDPELEPTKATAFRNVFSMDIGTRLFGAASGHLNNAGEAVKLLKPEDPLTLLTGDVLVDAVTYDESTPWPVAADGDGDSLTRTAPSDFAPLATSWTAETPTPGSVAFIPPMPGDFDTDGDVDGDDLAIWEGGFGATGEANLADGDADADGDVDGNDFLSWQHSYSGSTAPAVSAVVVADEFPPQSESNEAGGPLLATNDLVGEVEPKSTGISPNAPVSRDLSSSERRRRDGSTEDVANQYSIIETRRVSDVKTARERLTSLTHFEVAMFSQSPREQGNTTVDTASPTRFEVALFGKTSRGQGKTGADTASLTHRVSNDALGLLFYNAVPDLFYRSPELDFPQFQSLQQEATFQCRSLQRELAVDTVMTRLEEHIPRMPNTSE